MKHTKQITAGVLTAVCVASAGIPTYAESGSKDKQEVVYVMTDASGKVSDVEIVNIFHGGEITDYGDYSAVKVLNTTDAIHQEGSKITISSDAEKVYYQGTMNGKEIPWNISVRYFLDGKEYSASEIAGKSGALEIRLSVSKNQKCEGSFYENYALQTSLTMDSEKCTDILADGATLANVGNDRQISYTSLPGRGLDAVIRANVKDFEMDAVTVNGIRLNLNVEIDDAQLTEQVNDLINAVKQLDDGASALCGGSEALQNGAADLQTGASALRSGNIALDEGILALQSGLQMVQDGLDSLNAQSSALVGGSSEFQDALNTLQTAVSSISASEEELMQFVAASGKIKQAVSGLNAGAASLQANLGYAQYQAVMAQNGLDVGALAAGNESAIQTINEYGALLEEMSQIPEYSGVLESYKPGLLQAAEQMTGLLSANNAALGGMESYLNGISGELPALTEGLSELNAQYEAFDAAVGELAVNLGNMTGNLSALADGIDQLVVNYENLDSGVESYTDGVASLVAGYSQVMDGVSSLANGSRELVAGSGELYDGTANLYDGVASLCGGAKTMAEGTGKFRAETSGMNEKMEEEIDSILDAIGGDMEDAVSFASAKNTNVDSVQFAVKTAAVKQTEQKEHETVKQEKMNFGEKLLKLFGVHR